MSVEKLLDNNIIQELRANNIISQEEVAINSGDLFYAKNVLTNERRMLESSTINNLNKNESVASHGKTLLKG